MPRACVAEVITWQAPEKMEGTPPWYLGHDSLERRPVPVISFEAAVRSAPPPPGTRTRIVDFRGAEQPDHRRLFRRDHAGLPAARARQPRRGEVRSEPQLPRRGPVLCQVRMLNESPLIPDFEHLEADD